MMRSSALVLLAAFCATIVSAQRTLTEPTESSSTSTGAPMMMKVFRAKKSTETSSIPSTSSTQVGISSTVSSRSSTASSSTQISSSSSTVITSRSASSSSTTIASTMVMSSSSSSPVPMPTTVDKISSTSSTSSSTASSTQSSSTAEPSSSSTAEPISVLKNIAQGNAAFEVSPETDETPNSKTSTGLIVGSIALALLVILLAVGLFVMLKRRNEKDDGNDDGLNQEFFTFPQDEIPMTPGMQYAVGQRVPNQFVHVQNKENPAYASSNASSNVPIEIKSQFEARFEGGSHSQLRPVLSSQRSSVVKV